MSDGGGIREGCDVVTLDVTAFGWLRRSEMDTREHDIWERPDGALLPVRKGVVPKLSRIRLPPLAPRP